MKKKHIKFLKHIVETPSPTGCEVRVADIVRKRLGGIADEISTDTMGSVHACLHASLKEADTPNQGQGLEAPSAGNADLKSMDMDGGHIEGHHGAGASEGDGSPDPEGRRALTVMLAAHMDEIGLMVTYISDEGFLSIAAVGGVDAAILPGMRVDVHTQDGSLRGVVGRKPIHLIDPDDRKSVTPMDKLVIDLGMPAAQVRKSVRVGDQITIGVGFELFGDNMAVSRAFDDKVGVFIACRVMENLSKDPGYHGNFIAALTTQEEIGTRGAITSAHAIDPDVAIVFDVTHATDYPGIDKAKYGSIACGGGPVIARGPNINPVMFDALEQAALAEGIGFQLEAEPSVTGTDARSIQVSGNGVPTALISIPLRYMHTPTEVISLDDVEGAVRLITRFVKGIEDVDCFVPGLGEMGRPGKRHSSGKCRHRDAAAKAKAAPSDGSEVLDPADAPFGRQHDSLLSGFRGYEANGFAGKDQGIAQQSDGYQDGLQQGAPCEGGDHQTLPYDKTQSGHGVIGEGDITSNAPSISGGFESPYDPYGLDDPFEADPYIVSDSDPGFQGRQFQGAANYGADAYGGAVNEALDGSEDPVGVSPDLSGGASPQDLPQGASQHMPQGASQDMPQDMPQGMSQEYASLMEDDGYWSRLADNTPDKSPGYYADMSVLAPSDAEDTGPLGGIPVVKLDEFKED